MNSTDDKKTISSEALANIVWFGLVLLTLMSYLIAEGHFSSAVLTSLILLTAALKSILIAAVFMEMKDLPGFFLAFGALFFSILSWGLNFLFSNI